MYTQSQLTCDVRALGVRPDDVITVHTSLKAVGAIDAVGSTGADIFIDAMRAAVPEGLLLIPTHTFRNIREDGPVFNVRSTMPCIGTVPCAAVIRANRAVDAGDATCVRSLHVSHSVAAFGSGAREFVRADRLSRAAKAASVLEKSGLKYMILASSSDGAAPLRMAIWLR